MRIGIISDTHGDCNNLSKVLYFLMKTEVKTIVHCGDWDNLKVLKRFVGFQGCVWGVLGNCDGLIEDYRKYVEIFKLRDKINIEEKEIEINFGKKRCLIIHGNDKGRLQEVIMGGNYDVIFKGHSHLSSLVKQNNTLIIDPGAVSNNYATGKFKSCFAIFDTSNYHVSFKEL